ncbi:MAG: protoheme IX farnesyltransferase [Chloroflexota bacterium]|nr:MAG: protoheme IX farnesyltransferase [Chloroflexota bacterium]
MKGFRGIALASAIGVYLLIVMGAIVRVTGSGLGCPDWPLCHGQIVPPLEYHAILEYVHRSVAALVGIPLLLLLGVTLARYRSNPLIIQPVVWMMILLVPQIWLGREVVLRELPPMMVAIHLAIALVIMALAFFVATLVSLPGGERGGSAQAFPNSLGWTIVGVFVLLLTGAYMRAIGASWVCLGFPLCNGTWPVGNALADTHMLHRIVATIVGTAILWQAWRLPRAFPENDAVRLWIRLAGACAAAQFSIGVAQVLVPSQLLQVLHVALGAATWGAIVIVGSLVYLDLADRGQFGGTIRAYIALTKPRIISLLLVTALGGMFLAAKGLPPLDIVALTLAGGALAAGGANAINCYIDRDIDGVMGRTTLRPIPAGTVSPREALGFGIALTICAVGIFGLFVNPLAAGLSFAATLYYVFVYTNWLKRSTPSNIVIGGAAGALPPVIGWAAVRGDLELLPLWLFAIVFYWTPPHFWALALLIRREYERANVPMLPIVRGDVETRRQILLYSFVLVAVTALLTPFGLMGAIYLVAAILLGGVFIHYANRLRIEATAVAARRLFRYSIYYLTLIFAAMVIDRQIQL